MILKKKTNPKKNYQVILTIHHINLQNKNVAPVCFWFFVGGRGSVALPRIALHPTPPSRTLMFGIARVIA